ncbi:hypothetical protein TNCV_4505851 [Trichonephila clavipes]|nr:hypothetical protein TNCV_4505851 [Trichonephila clavipes]
MVPQTQIPQQWRCRNHLTPPDDSKSASEAIKMERLTSPVILLPPSRTAAQQKENPVSCNGYPHISTLRKKTGDFIIQDYAPSDWCTLLFDRFKRNLAAPED